MNPADITDQEIESRIWMAQKNLAFWEDMKRKKAEMGK